uniref:Ig-like domain-containing protein n=1 Tax=Poecilia reticulata TaxID=8081 RepID=A0A3P9PZT6_POERE
MCLVCYLQKIKTYNNRQIQTVSSSTEPQWHVSSLKKPSVGQKPIFIQPVTSCAVTHGEVARFHACVSGLPKPEISWFHNRQPVQPSKNVVFHFDEVTNIATLIIVDAFSEHAGQYTCRAVNNAGEAACSASLTVIREEEGNTWMCWFVARLPPKSSRFSFFKIEALFLKIKV